MQRTAAATEELPVKTAFNRSFHKHAVNLSRPAFKNEKLADWVVRLSCRTFICSGACP